MKIEYDGVTYEYDPEDLSIRQAQKIERHIWRGTVDAVKTAAQVQLQVLQQAHPGLDLTALRSAVDDLAKAAEAAGAGTLLDWEMGLLRSRSDCVQALAWLVLHEGRTVPIADVEVKVVKLANAFARAQAAEEQAQSPGPSAPRPRPRKTPAAGTGG